MGIKYGGDDIFEAAMRGLMKGPEATPKVVRRTAEPLIKELLAFGWDNAASTLGLYQDNPAIVAAFKANGIVLTCGAEHPDDGESCEEERGHPRSIPHRDYLERTWTEGEEST